MRTFRYARAATAAEAAALAAAEPGAMFVAGGTDLSNLMKDGVHDPDLLIDLNPVPLDRIARHGDGARIGALARMAAVAADRLIRRNLPLVSDALLASASAQVRNAATIGGNLLQRTRCWYFRDAAMPCNTRVPGSGCGAIDGENRWHAIFGGSPSCIKVHPSDLAVALAALDAAILLQDAQGTRSVPIADFYTLPGSTPHIETVLRHGELITGVDVPFPPAAARSGYLKVRDRASFEFAVVSVAAVLDLRGGTVRDIRLALGGVAPKPWRLPAAEDALRGRRISSEVVEQAAEAAVQGATPREGNGFKVELVKRALTKVLRDLSGA